MATRKSRTSSRPRPLGPAERAVYDLVERGGMTAAHAALYQDQLDVLEAAGLVERGPSGAYVAPQGVHGTPIAPRAVPMATLVLRVPAAVLEALDGRIAAPGETRSDVARSLLMKGLGMAPLPTGPGKRLPSVRRPG